MKAEIEELKELASDMDMMSWSLNSGHLGDYAKRLLEIVERLEQE